MRAELDWSAVKSQQVTGTHKRRVNVKELITYLQGNHFSGKFTCQVPAHSFSLLLRAGMQSRSYMIFKFFIIVCLLLVVIFTYSYTPTYIHPLPRTRCLSLYYFLWGHPWHSGKALDCWSTSRVIDPAPVNDSTNIHLISPGCRRPSIALQCRNVGYNIHFSHFLSLFE